jgi:hypothetical protein
VRDVDPGALHQYKRYSTDHPQCVEYLNVHSKRGMSFAEVERKASRRRRGAWNCRGGSPKFRYRRHGPKPCLNQSPMPQTITVK